MRMLSSILKIKGTKMSFLFVLFLICNVFINHSQSQITEIDSLKLLVSSSHDEDAINYFNIADIYLYSNYDSALLYTNLALAYAKKNNDYALEIKSLILGAQINTNIGNNLSALKLLQEAKNLSLSKSNNELLARTYLAFARYYNSKFNYYKVIGCVDTAITLINKYKIASFKAEILNYTGNVFFKINDLQSAEYYANHASDALKEHYILSSELLNLHLKASIASRKGNIKLAFNYYSKALNLSKRGANANDIQLSYRRLASYYIDLKRFDTATRYTDSALVVSKQIGLKINESSLITYKAHIESLKGDIERALQYNFEALQIRKSTGHKSSISSSLLNIAGNYILLNDYSKAYEYVERGLAIAKDQNILRYIARGYGQHSTLFKLEGKYEGALKYTELKTQLTDSILLKRTNDKVMLFSNLYELEKGKRQVEQIRLRKKSNEVLFLIIGTILAIGVIILLFRINFVRKKSTKEILKLSKIIETTDQAVAISNNNGKMVYVNNGLVKMLGYSSISDFIDVSIFSYTDARGKHILVNDIFPNISTSKSWKGEITLLKEDSTPLIAELICSIIKDKQSNSNLFVAIFNDITQRKKNEAELKDSRETLKKAVDTQDRIFSIIAHDLTGPFNTILGFSEIMAKDYSKHTINEHVRFSKIIYESSKNTFDLLTNLLHWSRSQLGKIEINNQHIDLFKLVDDNCQLLKQMVSNKEITLINEIKPSTGIFADKDTLSIVIRNLLSNAIKFTPQNGLIKISSTSNIVGSKITISDNGVGITPQHLDELFNPKTTTTKAGTNNEKGTGLGLMLCKELVNLNGGEIEVTSTLGNGSSFIITLPK